MSCFMLTNMSANTSVCETDCIRFASILHSNLCGEMNKFTLAVKWWIHHTNTSLWNGKYLKMQFWVCIPYSFFCQLCQYVMQKIFRKLQKVEHDTMLYSQWFLLFIILPVRLVQNCITNSTLHITESKY